ncbi:sensor histidine kinase [Cereibacter sphaeroides]|uniref:sensor histidine kinase n=1 Tax=Cereibacter sphaeroides TaxID=1063 RepID=UPI001F462703|nr:ATP-binding protein [Cereibacter sphaeroides]MCE6970515.1 HAMP domain-containing protein [Cereibacter sphaeroides]
MRVRSLQARLALILGAGVTVLWVGSATVTSRILHVELDEVFDSTLEETAQRILPLAVMEIVGREEPATGQRIAALRAHEEFYTYLVRDAGGAVLIASHRAEPADFPPCTAPGFTQTATHRLYCDLALRGTVTIAVAEPLSHRAQVARELGMALGLPLVVIIPLALAGIVAVVRWSFRPVRALRDALARRGAGDLAPVGEAELPTEIAPVAAAVNQLLERLRAAFEAERSFAVHAAHELRTPVAGATAQAQRIRIETSDPRAAGRAADIEATLKRLTRLSDKLMQLARAEGGRGLADRPADLRPILSLVVQDFTRAGAGDRLVLALPEAAVPSRIDPDAFAILCRNLIENALRHGAPGEPVEVTLTPGRDLSVRNGGTPVPPDALARLTHRFERAPGAGEGSGLGLSIVRTIVERAGGTLGLRSPIPGRADGFEAKIELPA